MNSSCRKSKDNLQKKDEKKLKDMKAKQERKKKKTKKAFHPSSLRFSFLFFLLFSSFLNNTNNEKTASSGSNENFFSHIFFIIIIIILRFILSIFLWETNLLCQKVCFHNNIKLISFFFASCSRFILSIASVVACV